jgi:cation transport ATPase
MPSRRTRARLGFALFAILTIVGLFVINGPDAGLVLLAAMIVFIIACIHALSLQQDSGAVDSSHRAGVTGWFGGWF